MKSVKEHPPDFDKTSQTITQGPSSTISEYTLQDGYLRKDDRLCNSRALFRGFLVWQIPWPLLETFV